jgi:hypothetical protein
MTEQVKSLRLRPEEPEFLNSQDFEQGQLFLRQDTNELVIMGDQRGGVALLKADLSNIQGGGSGSGSVDFGSRTIIADAFQGDGSQLTNLPVPAGVATLTDITTAIAAIPPASTTVFGLVKVDGTTITINGSGVISAVGGGGGGGGVDLTAFSVAAEPAASGNGGLTYANTTGVFTYTPPDLSSFLTSYTETDTLATVTQRGATTTDSMTIENQLIVQTLTVNWDAEIGGTLAVKDILNSGTGAPRWTSGSDFTIDMPGDLLLSGSKIRGVADPLVASDVATKNYVDGAASAFDGGTVSGVVNITNTTASTNKDNGALIVNGGVGVEGSLYAGGLIYVFDALSSTYSPVLTSSSGGYNGGIISGTVFINNSTTSTSTTTGALRVLGGVGIQGQLTVGPDGRFNGIRIGRGSASGVGSDTNLAIGGGVGNDAPLALNSSGLRNVALGLGTLSSITSSSDNVAIGRYAMRDKGAGDNNVAIGSNSLTAGSGSSNTAIGVGALGTSTGSSNTAVGHDALHEILGSNNIALGYLAGSSMTSGDNNVLIGNNDGITINGENNNILISDGAGTIRLTVDEFGTMTLPSNIVSSNSTTGTLVVTGGVGISGALNVGGALGIAGQISISNTTASTSTSTGSIVTLGGIGVAGNVHATGFYGDGANLTNITAAGFAGGTVPNATTFTSLVTINNGISTNNTANISMGSGTRQMLNLFGTAYGLGIQTNSLYYRSAGTFRWHRGGVHSNTEGAPGTGGTQALVLDASSNLTATGNVTAFSDERLKTDVEIITDPIGKILQLNGVTFTRIDTGQRGLGVIAQQVQRVLPELIVVDENGYLSVAYGNLTGLLIEGVKAHEQDISQLKSQVAAQQLMIEQLMSRLSALEGSR